MYPTASLRTAALLLWFNALGFGLPCLLTVRNLATGGKIPMVLGFPAYGRGPLEGVGVPTTLPLALAFLGVCTLEGVAGYLLWARRRVGAILALALLPAGGFFWWGFALPFPPIAALARTLLIARSWRRLG